MRILVIHVNIPELYGRQRNDTFQKHSVEKCDHESSAILICSHISPEDGWLPGLLQKRLPAALVSLPRLPVLSTLFTGDKWQVTSNREQRAVCWMPRGKLGAALGDAFVSEVRVCSEMVGERPEARCLVVWGLWRRWIGVGVGSGQRAESWLSYLENWE